MTTEEISQYKVSAKRGDRIQRKTYTDVWHVQDVVPRGVIVSLLATRPDHVHLIDFEWMGNYNIIHKEP